jgi:O-antigen/teichoic acid export membrane protein
MHRHLCGNHWAVFWAPAELLRMRRSGGTHARASGLSRRRTAKTISKPDLPGGQDRLTDSGQAEEVKPESAGGHDEMALRRRGLHSGVQLAVREVLGLAIRLGGLLLLTRVLGAESYGVYAGAAALIMLLTFVAQLSMDTYLLRSPAEPAKRIYDEVFTLLLISSTVAAMTGFALTVLFPGLIADPRMAQAFQVLLLAIPIGVLKAPAKAKLERALRFRRIAFLEITGDALLYGVALVLSAVGLSYWGPVLGFLAFSSFLFVGSFLLAAYRPAIRLSRTGLRDALRYGVPYVGSMWVSLGREILNPLLVGRYLGTEAVGVVALASRITEALSIFSRPVWRIARVVIGRVQNDAFKLARAVHDGTGLQLAVLGPIMVAFVLISPVIVPLAFGSGWEPVIDLLPVFCTSTLIGVTGYLWTIVLTTHGQMRTVATLQYLRLGFLLLAAPPLITELDIRGFAFAELIAILVSTSLLALTVGRTVPGLRFGYLLPLAATMIPPLYWHDLPPQLRPLLLLPGALAITIPAVRRQYAYYLATIISALFARLRVPWRRRAGAFLVEEQPTYLVSSGRHRSRRLAVSTRA